MKKMANWYYNEEQEVMGKCNNKNSRGRICENMPGFKEILMQNVINEPKTIVTDIRYILEISTKGILEK